MFYCPASSVLSSSVQCFIVQRPVFYRPASSVLPSSASLLLLFFNVQTGCLATVLLAINNLRDIDTDRKVAKNTLAVQLGRTFARCEITALMLVAYATLPYWAISKRGGGGGSMATYMAAALPAITAPGAANIARRVWMEPPGKSSVRFEARPRRFKPSPTECLVSIPLLGGRRGQQCAPGPQCGAAFVLRRAAGAEHIRNRGGAIAAATTAAAVPGRKQSGRVTRRGREIEPGGGGPGRAPPPLFLPPSLSGQCLCSTRTKLECSTTNSGGAPR